MESKREDRSPAQTPGEEAVYLMTAMVEGVEKHYVTFLPPGDIEQNGLPPEASKHWKVYG